jgi:IS30 family transposase
MKTIKKKARKKGGYSHISLVERKEIEILLEKGRSQNYIAKTLKRGKGTISEEVKNNSVNGIYSAKKAHHKAYAKRKYSKYQGMKVVQDNELRSYIEKNIKDDQSPETIAGRLREMEKSVKYAGKGAIYKFVYSVYGRQLERHLYHNAVHKKSGPKRKRSGELSDRMFIGERPKYIGNRRFFGDWEGDFIVSPKDGSGALLVLQERKSKYAIIKKLASRNNDEVNRTIYEITGSMVCFNSLTLDNDIAFKKHKELSELLGVNIYFCEPYKSWQKGGVENMNKLIRRYIPKRTDVSKISDEYVKKVEDKLNNKFRKCLNYKTAYEVMKENNLLKFNACGILEEIKKHPVGVSELSSVECSV